MRNMNIEMQRLLNNTICGDDMTKDKWYKQLFERLNNSKFRSSFHLKQKDIDYINEKDWRESDNMQRILSQKEKLRHI